MKSEMATSISSYLLGLENKSSAMAKAYKMAFS